MIAHQHPCPDTDAAPLAALSERLEEQFLVSPVGREEDSIASVSAGHDVIEGSLVLDADLTRHGGTLSCLGILSNTEFVS